MSEKSCPSCEAEDSIRPGKVTQRFPYPNELSPSGVTELEVELDVDCCITCGYCSVTGFLLWQERGRRIMTHLRSLAKLRPDLYLYKELENGEFFTGLKPASPEQP